MALVVVIYVLATFAADVDSMLMFLSMLLLQLLLWS